MQSQGSGEGAVMCPTVAPLAQGHQDVPHQTLRRAAQTHKALPEGFRTRHEL